MWCIGWIVRGLVTMVAVAGAVAWGKKIVNDEPRSQPREPAEHDFRK